MNLPWIAFGLAFVLMGLVSLGLVAVAVIGQGDLVFALGVVPAALGLGVGLLITVSIPYDVTFEDRCLKMFFAFRGIEVPWQCVRSQRKLFIRMSFRGGHATVYTLVTYQLPERRPARALLMLQGTGPALGLSASEYKTELDRYIPANVRRANG